MDLDMSISTVPVTCFLQGHSLGGLSSWRLHFVDVDWIWGFLGVLLERYSIIVVFNWNSSNIARLMSGRGHGGKCGRPRRHEMPMLDEILA
ncbi:hypothetical protein CsSME_00002011 [Camellia sinensis var. sinensis]